MKNKKTFSKFSGYLLRISLTLPAILLTLLLTLLSTGCNLPTGSSQPFDATKAALDVQATIQAQQVQKDTLATSESSAATQIAQEVQATLVSQQSTQIAEQQAEDEPLPTDIPPTPANTPAPDPTQPKTPTEIPPTPTPDIDAMVKSAKILLFEDMAGEYEVRYVKNALDIMGLSYTDVGDASGEFKTQLLSGTDWDLIIVSNEARSNIQGEFFVYLNDHLSNGTAEIIEVWALDEIASGKISNILSVQYTQPLHQVSGKLPLSRPIQPRNGFAM